MCAAGSRLLVISALFMIVIWSWYLLPPSSAPLATTSGLDCGLPRISVDLRPAHTPSIYNGSKVALLIEDRAIPHLAPQLLHMMSVVPPEWRFVFLGSQESIDFLNRSLPVRAQEASGKLDMVRIPARWNVKGHEPLSQTLTNASFWEWLGGRETWDWRKQHLDENDAKWRTGWAEEYGSGTRRRAQIEWVLVFQTDSIMCANAKTTLNEWLDYDWVGAPWNAADRFGGNGGLSLRRVSRMLQVLRFQQRTPRNIALEDLWLVQRIAHLPGAKMANGTTELAFSVEHIWAEEPLGYHTGWSGNLLPDGAWGTKEKRDKIWKHCPEIKMILPMELQHQGCDEDEDAVKENVGKGKGRAGPRKYGAKKQESEKLRRAAHVQMERSTELESSGEEGPWFDVIPW